MDKLSNSEDAKRLLQGLGLHIDEAVVRQVVNVLSGKAHQSLYSLYATRPDKPPPVCGKGSVSKIKKLYDEGELRPYLDYLSDSLTIGEAKGLETNDIAIQLDYPLPFVSIAVDKANTMRTEAEEQGQTTQPPSSFDFKAEWEEFKRQQSLEIAKEKLQERAGELIDDLKNVESELIKEKATSTDWLRRIGSLKKELTDFVLPQVTKADSKESLSALESIVEEIDHKVLSLYEEHQYQNQGNQVSSSPPRKGTVGPITGSADRYSSFPPVSQEAGQGQVHCQKCRRGFDCG